jgi:hypothetical protein
MDAIRYDYTRSWSSTERKEGATMLRDVDFDAFFRWIASRPNGSVVGYPKSVTDSPLVRWLTFFCPAYRFQQFGYLLKYWPEGSDQVERQYFGGIRWAAKFVTCSLKHVKKLAEDNDEVDQDVLIPLYREDALDILERIDQWGV